MVPLLVSAGADPGNVVEPAPVVVEPDPVVDGALVLVDEAPASGDGFICEPPPAPLCICCWEFAGGSVLGLV